ncbi:hypothetical protein PDE_09524 [Penicillium oxalicum 114-2]|uniref:Uncharacterized protein n=1 Tax=Penicillium oxalicum (strain 114-2 / CGMCC 5302) TaxID=933388 RepID=S7ZUY8_PENO1|nr:hypothetical protein PDE_09524 [Penicillium oxalicum 114-2]
MGGAVTDGGESTEEDVHVPLPAASSSYRTASGQASSAWASPRLEKGTFKTHRKSTGKSISAHGLNVSSWSLEMVNSDHPEYDSLV